MSAQLESRHFFRSRDTVRRRDGLLGSVVDARALYAVIRWMDGRDEEIDQFDSSIEVIDRAEPA